MLSLAGDLAGIIKAHDVIKVVTHIDADGITAGSIAAQSLKRAGKEWTIQFEKQLDPPVITRLTADFDRLAGEGAKVLYWFTDFGSGQVEELAGIDYIITDHHLPVVPETEEEAEIPHRGISTELNRRFDDAENEGEEGGLEEEEGAEEDKESQTSSPLSGQTSLFDFYGSRSESTTKEKKAPAPDLSKERQGRELNPHFFGLSGADHISGAGVSYLVAKMLGEENEDLAPLAVVGAVGDLQDTRHCHLVGLNEFLVEDAERHGLRVSYDIRSFGRETRPVFKLLQYTNDPIIPGLTGDQGNSMAFMVYCDEPLAEGSGSGEGSTETLNHVSYISSQDTSRNWRKWVDLGWESKKTMLSNLVKLLLYRGISRQSALRLLGDTYALENELMNSPLRDAKEFATLLNACGRYGNADIGYKVCSGDRGRFLEKALLLLKGHRRVLVDNIKYVQDTGVTEREFLQFFHGRDVIPENVVGIVAGMVLGSGEVNENLPIIGFTNSPDGIKVSGRTVRRVVNKGVNLAQALNRASKEVGGGGGGHNIAAGAHIPIGKEEEFLTILEDIIERQIREKKK